MKSFYTACAILITIFISVVLISCNISKELTEFRDDISNLPEEYSDKYYHKQQSLEQLINKWEGMKTLLSLTVPHTEMMRVEPELYSMNVYYCSKSSHNYKASRARLLCAVEALLDTEKLWWKNIF